MKKEDIEHGNDGVCTNTEQAETIVLPESKPDVGNAFLRKSNMEAIITIQIGITAEHMLSKESSPLLADSFNDVLECSC